MLAATAACLGAAARLRAETARIAQVLSPARPWGRRGVRSRRSPRRDRGDTGGGWPALAARPQASRAPWAWCRGLRTVPGPGAFSPSGRAGGLSLERERGWKTGRQTAVRPRPLYKFRRLFILHPSAFVSRGASSVSPHLLAARAAGPPAGAGRCSQLGPAHTRSWAPTHCWVPSSAAGPAPTLGPAGTQREGPR